MNHLLDELSLAVNAAIAALATWFVLVYARRPWRSRIGWTLMVSEVSIAVVFIAQVVVWTIGPFPGVHLVQLAIFALILLGQGSLLWAVLAARSQRSALASRLRRMFGWVSRRRR